MLCLSPAICSVFKLHLSLLLVLLSRFQNLCVFAAPLLNPTSLRFRKMGSSQSWVCWHRNRHLVIPILLVLVSSFNTHLSFIAQATRPIPTKLPEAAKESFSQEGYVLEGENAGGGERVNAREIGSRPPQCGRACGGCGHCVAVQVPVAPQKHNIGEKRSSRGGGAATSTSTTRNTSPKRTAYTRGGDELSNYKPISWKCKCGDLLFDP